MAAADKAASSLATAMIMVQAAMGVKNTAIDVLRTELRSLQQENEALVRLLAHQPSGQPAAGPCGSAAPAVEPPQDAPASPATQDDAGAEQDLLRRQLAAARAHITALEAELADTAEAAFELWEVVQGDLTGGGSGASSPPVSAVGCCTSDPGSPAGSLASGGLPAAASLAGPADSSHGSSRHCWPGSDAHGSEAGETSWSTLPCGLASSPVPAGPLPPGDAAQLCTASPFAARGLRPHSGRSRSSSRCHGVRGSPYSSLCSASPVPGAGGGGGGGLFTPLECRLVSLSSRLRDMLQLRRTATYEDKEQPARQQRQRGAAGSDCDGDVGSTGSGGARRPAHPQPHPPDLAVGALDSPRQAPHLPCGEARPLPLPPKVAGARHPLLGAPACDVSAARDAM